MKNSDIDPILSPTMINIPFDGNNVLTPTSRGLT